MSDMTKRRYRAQRPSGPNCLISLRPGVRSTKMTKMTRSLVWLAALAFSFHAPCGHQSRPAAWLEQFSAPFGGMSLAGALHELGVRQRDDLHFVEADDLRSLDLSSITIRRIMQEARRQAAESSTGNGFATGRGSVSSTERLVSSQGRQPEPQTPRILDPKKHPSYVDAKALVTKRLARLGLPEVLEVLKTSEEYHLTSREAATLRNMITELQNAATAAGVDVNRVTMDQLLLIADDPRLAENLPALGDAPSRVGPGFEPRNDGAPESIDSTTTSSTTTTTATTTVEPSCTGDPGVDSEGRLHRPESTADALFFLGNMLQNEGLTSAAQNHYHRALELEPEHESSVHFLSALTGDGSVDRASPAFVKRLFDSYAPHFDHHLVDVLQYQVPQLLRAGVLESLQAQRSTTKKPSGSPADEAAAVVVGAVLDLGCGTGLAGPLFRDLASRLVGVDLSPAMLAKARARGTYDELYESDMVTFVERQAAGSYDLAIASDAFCYVGELGPVLRACHGALAEAGHLAFTVETAANAAHGSYRLHPTTGRFSHSREYVQRLAGETGFAVRTYQPAKLGNHEKFGRAGALYVLEKQKKTR